MWLDPRIQGRLKELLEESYESFLKVGGKSLDQAVNVVDYAKSIGNEFEIAIASLHLGRVLLSLSEYDKAFDVFTNIRSYATNVDEKLILAESYNGIGAYHRGKAEIELAIKAFKESAKACEGTGIHKFLHKPLLNLAEEYTIQGRWQDALNILFRVKDEIERSDRSLWQSTDYDNARYYCYSGLGTVYNHLNSHEDEIKYKKLTIEIATSNDWKYHIAIQNQRLGVAYTDMEEYDNAIGCFENIIKSDILDKVNPWRIGAMSGLALCLYSLKQYDRAESVIEEAYEACMSSETKRQLPRLLYYKGIIKVEKGDPQGIRLLSDALDLYKRSTMITDLDEILSYLHKYYKAVGDYEEALNYQEQLYKHTVAQMIEKERSFSKIHAHQEEERSEQENRIYQLELEKKEHRLQYQERELALTASQLASQVDLLSHFRNDLREIVRGIGDPIDALRSIKQKLKELPCEQIDWAKFESEFIAVHPEFRQKLLSMFPDLTPQETKMCLLVRLGLKNSEIARLTCLSERTVDNHRFNLRKKLGIKTEQNLTQFLATIK